MGFNADGFLAARRPWTLTVGGVGYAARPLSVQAILDFQAQVQAASLDERAAQRAVASLVRQMFPRKWTHWFGWFDPGQWLLAQEAGMIQAALTDFFGHLARGMTPHPTPATTTTPPGPPSAPPTRPRLEMGAADLDVTPA